MNDILDKPSEYCGVVGIYGDENATYRWSVLREPVLATGKPASLLDINLALSRLCYYVIGQPWSIRIPSLIFSLGAIVAAGFLARQVLGKKNY